MTPKEKAKELFCKMYGCEINANLEDIYIINGDGYFIAKDSSLIAVYEILDILTFDLGHDQTARKLEEHWQQIKNELLKQQNNG